MNLLIFLLMLVSVQVALIHWPDISILLTGNVLVMEVATDAGFRCLAVSLASCSCSFRGHRSR